MILPALLSLSVTVQDVPNPRDQRIVRAFVTAARTGLDGEVLPPFPTEGEEPQLATHLENRTDATLGRRTFQFAEATVTLNTRIGRVTNYQDERPYFPSDALMPDGTAPRRVTDDEAIAQAQRFYTAAGWPERIDALALDGPDGVLRRVDDRESGPRGVSLEIHYVPIVGEVPYDRFWQGMVDVNRWTGRLDAFYAVAKTPLPLPPPSVAPGGPASAARAIALRQGADRLGEVVAESRYEPFVLCVWYPVGDYRDPTPLARRPYPARARAAILEGRGILAYVGRLAGGSWQCGVRVAIDAVTGETIEVLPAYPPGGTGGGGGGGALAPQEALHVPTASRPWRVGTGKGGWRAWTPAATAALVPAPKPPAKGAKILLTDGRAAFPAVYDAKANLLGIVGKGYRPGPGLAKLLRRRTQTKSR